jgi:cyclic beta-1,2-glucan synthetase
MPGVIALGFFADPHEARDATRAAQRAGFRRTGRVHKKRDGSIVTWDPFPLRRLVALAASALALGVLAGGAAAVLGWAPQALPGHLPILTAAVAGASIGALVAGLWVQRSRFGVERRLLRDHARWLVPEESVLILQTPLGALTSAVAVLREGVEVPPIIFFLHPKREWPEASERPAGVALSLPQFEEHARRLAAEHRVDATSPPSMELLKRLARARRWVHRVSEDLAVASRLEQGPSPVAEWILDNEYILEGNAIDVRLNLPRSYFQELPTLASASVQGLPRVYSLASELVSHTDLRLDQDNILAFVKAYQSVQPLTIGELWAYPQMLRIALIDNIQHLAAKALTELREREIADFWANRLMTVSRRDSNQLFAILAELAEAQPSPSPYFASQLVDHLYDEEGALAPVQGWLERIYRKPLGELNLREQTRQTRDQISITNAFTSLRQLALLDWRQIFEDLSHVERTLRRDPAGVYGHMDFETRDRYRKAVEGLARARGASEDSVALEAISLAARAASKAERDERRRHVGSYLVGEGRSQLVRAVGSREARRFRLLQWAYTHPSLVYFAGVGLGSLGILGAYTHVGLASLPAGLRVLVAMLALIPVSQLALNLVDYLVTRLLPPRTLPKMDFERSGIPDIFRTLVVVPEMLVDPDQIRSVVEKLEVRFLANQEANVFFGLFTDYADADQAHHDGDEALLKTARECIEALNRRYPGERFFLFHRDRVWSETERKYIGWDRKRGKLEELNRLLDGTRPEESPRLVHVGDADRLSDVRFVITLDSDTQLPSGTARRLIETLAHPLNQPRFDARGRVTPGTFSIIQPRVTTSLPSATATPFARLFTDAVGIDPYTKAVSDVSQDLFGEGSYHGKGIYDVRAFSRVLSGRFPEERLLSHDLLEGAHVGVGLASDIELLDEFPPDYLSHTGRQHRWIRGDWQISDWATPRAPVAGGGYAPNTLTGFNRWKILDNLRRSLVSASSVALLIASWILSSDLGWASASLVTSLLLFQPVTQVVTWMTTRRGLRSFSLSKVAHDLLRTAVEAALLPHQAGLALDAILRVAYRRLISHRGLLEWTSAQAMSWSAPSRMAAFVLSMGLTSLFSGATAWAIHLVRPANWIVAGPWLAAWFLSPLVGWLLNRHPHARRVQETLPPKDRLFLRMIARRTWRYFSDFANAETSWLPPDNYQVSHREQVAMRTSPTNIGLWMLSTLAAHDFGYLTLDQVVDRLTRTLTAIGKLERFEGHLLNWYDVQTLTPLEPRYVSAVDSGNLLGALWCLKHGLEELASTPVLDSETFEGLGDTWEVWKQDAEGQGPVFQNAPALAGFRRAASASPLTVVEALSSLRAAAAELRSMGDHPRGSWAGQMADQVSGWVGLADRYLAWTEILHEKTEAELAPLGPDVVEAIRQDLRRAPSLRDLATGRVRSMAILRSIHTQAPPGSRPLHEWLDRLIESFDRSKWLAGEMLAVVERLIEDVGGLAYSINMRFLYDPERRLFAIGYSVSSGRLDQAYYDLLASEARLGSFVAIAGGSVPIEHWFSMSRPYNAIGRHRVLLSWTGTMFEYLMPLLLQRSFSNALLDQAARQAVAAHRAYGRRRRVPWGISECAYGDLDLAKTYQYKAFGVPELGLKRDLEQELVVAPYATLLALPIAPRGSVRNLRRLADLGLLNTYGYYEAMDFSRRPRRRGERGVVVRAYMAHHQGMGLLSIANVLHGQSFQRRFHAEPRVRAVESLLHERVPTLPPLHHISTRDRLPTVESVGEAAPSVSKFDTPHSPTPKTQLLSNGRYGLMVSNAGGGYSQWGDFEITRWRSDRTQDSWGTFCYLRDPESDRLWSNTYHPTGGKTEGYHADFALDRATFRRIDAGIHTETEIIVSPEDDVEIRRLTLINRSLRIRRIDLTSYIELVMAPHSADRQHPAFNKLFIQTEAVPEHQALLAYRRLRSEDDPPIFVAHRLTATQPDEAETLRFETDRRRFIGRGRTLTDPMGASHEPGCTQGTVLDPILSLRRTVTLVPGERQQVSLVLAAGETRERALQYMVQYSDPQVIERAMDVAWASAQLELRLLRIQADDGRRFQKLASHLLYPNPTLRPSADRVEERNRKGQSGLWAYGISGDLPIALVTIGEARDLHLVRQVLQAHTYWRTHGLAADLVILNEEAGGYEQPLRERLEALIRLHSMYTGVDKPGGVFLRSAEHIPDEDQRLLMAASSVALVAARGTLPQQLGVAVETPDLPGPLLRKRGPREPSSPLPFMELPYFNSLGGFTPDGREYAIYLGPDTHTPAPWVNVIANPSFGTMVSETGAGYTWYGNSQRNRLTPWSNDPVLDPPSDAIYLRDEETGEYWTPTAAPIREPLAYRARHGAGYTIFEHNSHALQQELTVLVPVDDQGGAPVKLQRLRLTNESTRRRRVSVTFYTEWALGENRETSQTHIVTSWDEDVHALTARNRYHPDFGDRVAFAALSRAPDSHTGDRTAFLGRNRSMANPAAMERLDLSERTGAGHDPCAALRTSLEIAPGETVELTCLIGQAATVEEVHRLVHTYREALAFEAALDQAQVWWDNLLGTLEVHTPERAVDFLVNRWLLYQNLSCRIWGRSAFYQSGGAFGFRDQLQDVMALLHARPGLAREHILLAASRQFREGDVQHWWHPPSGAGIRSRISDDLLWLPYVVSQYVRVTGDTDILRTPVPFLDGPTLTDKQHDLFLTPDLALERGTLYEHCRRAVGRGLTSGPHGLPLIGTGDWNDSMDRVGPGGGGESVWLAWFLVDVLERMAELAEVLGEKGTAEEDRKRRDSLLACIEQSAWDGAWYRRASFDDGTPVGSATSLEAQIDLLPQAWAWISGGGDPDRAAQALESAWQRLVKPDEGLVLLFDPPFDRTDPSPGYVRGYPPGVRENGGQYTHAAMWLAIALARRGDGTRAAEVLRILNPIESAREAESVWRYGVEPYVLAADVYRAPGWVGHGGWSWYTGSAAWMYRAWVEEVLGLKVRGQSMRIDPVIPAWWDGFRLTYRHVEAVYEIQVENPEGVEHGVVSMQLDGRPIADGGVPLEKGLVKHRLVVRLGRPPTNGPGMTVEVG